MTLTTRAFIGVDVQIRRGCSYYGISSTGEHLGSGWILSGKKCAESLHKLASPQWTPHVAAAPKWMTLGFQIFDAVGAFVVREFVEGRGCEVGGGDGLSTIILPCRLNDQSSSVHCWPVPLESESTR
jgi:hypothetical protein